MPAFPSDNLPPTPEMLSQRFNLEERGSENGEDGKPTQGDPGLDKVETEVQFYCQQLLGQRLESYRKEIDVLAERMDENFLLPVSQNETDQEHSQDLAAMDPDAPDPATEKARFDLENVIDIQGPKLKRYKSKAQDMIDELNNFKVKHSLEHAPNFSDSLLQSWGIFVIAVGIETVLNGIFFGANMAGAIGSGIPIAAMISVINVMAFGKAGAETYRQIAHRVSWRKFVGIVGFIITIFLVICFNFAVAHYRDALPPDYPPAPETVSAEVTEVELQIAQCWRGDQEFEASQEALCLLTTRMYRLDGFMSYLLWLIGLIACAIGVWKFLRKWDPYPGYGELGHKHRNKLEELEKHREEVLEDLKNTWLSLRKKQESAFDDPVERWKRTDGAIKKRSKLYEDFLAYATALEESCAGAIRIYRQANRNARNVPQSIPSHWNEHWKAGWELPDKPPALRIYPLSHAKAQKQREQTLLNKQLEAINSCYNKCKGEVEAMTKLKFAAKMGSQHV